jgi:PPP family 3-phenylpropionic acid transporter
MRVLSVKGRFSAFLFLFYAAGGFFMPYFVVYLTRNGLTGTQAGLLLGLMSLVGIIAQPFWSMLSDVYQVRKAVLVSTCLGTGLSALGFFWSRGFAAFLLTALLNALIRAPIVPLSNALTLDYLERRGDEDAFGPVRSWGSVGFGLTALIGGTFFLGASLAVVPLVYSVLMALLALLALTLPDAHVSAPVRWIDGLRLLPQRPALALFMLGALLVIAPMMTATQYVSIFMEDLGAADWLTGLSVSVMAFYEIPMMTSIPGLTKRFSIRQLLLGSVVIAPFRWLLFLLVRTPAWIIPIQALHSITVTGLMVIGVVFLDKQLPPRWRATGQGFYTSAILGIGPSLWQFVCGLLFELRGVRFIWLASLGVAIVGLLVTRSALARLETTGA